MAITTIGEVTSQLLTAATDQPPTSAFPRLTEFAISRLEISSAPGIGATRYHCRDPILEGECTVLGFLAPATVPVEHGAARFFVLVLATVHGASGAARCPLAPVL